MPATYTITSVGSEWTVDSERGKTVATTVFLVQASEPVTPAAVALNATGLLVVGGDYPDSLITGLPCVKRRIRAVDQTRMLFRVECDHDNSIGTVITSPLSVPTKFSYSTETYEESYYKDKSSTPKLARNTAGTPFSELPKRDADILVIEIEKNVAASTTLASLWSLTRKINSDSVTLDGNAFSAGQLRVTALALSEVKTENGTSYKTKRITVKANPDGWDQKFESVGMEEIVGGVNWPIVDPATGKPTATPWPLTTAGAATSTRATAGAEIVLKPYDATALSGIA